MCLWTHVGVPSHPHDLGVAAGAGRGEELAVAVLAVDVVLFLHEADVGQRHVAVVAVKLLGVPGPAQRHQEGTPDHNQEDSVQTFQGKSTFLPPRNRNLHL